MSRNEQMNEEGNARNLSDDINRDANSESLNVRIVDDENRENCAPSKDFSRRDFPAAHKYVKI